LVEILDLVWIVIIDRFCNFRFFVEKNLRLKGDLKVLGGMNLQ